MKVTTKIADRRGRAIIVSHRHTTRGSGITPSVIKFWVSVMSASGIAMEVKIPNNCSLYDREKEETLYVAESWSNSALVENVLSAINAVSVGDDQTLVMVEHSKYTAYQGMVVI